MPLNLFRSRRPGPSFLFALGLCCFLTTARAQYVIDSWTTDKGLPQNSVLAIQQTPDGYLWFTTFDGLVRFDGVRFTVFNKGNSPGLTSNRFIHLSADHDGVLWAGTEDGGLIRYRNGAFRAWTMADGLAANTVMNVQRDIDGSLRIETSPATSHLSADDHIVTDPLRDWLSHKTYISPAGSRWDANAAGLLLTRNGHQTRYPLPFDLRPASGAGSFSIRDLQFEETEGGVLWLVARGCLYRMDGGTVTAYTVRDGMPQSSVHAIAHDRDGNIWLATEKDGACRFAANRFTCYRATDGLSSDFATSIAQDREGSIWVGANDGGINRLTHRVVTPLSAAAGLPERNVYPILEDHSGDLWIGTTNGLAQVRDKRVIRFFRRRDGLRFLRVEGLYEDRAGRLWIGSDDGIEYYANGRFTDFAPSLRQPKVSVEYWFIHQDAAGALWFGTNRGLLRYQDGNVRRYTVADGLPSNDVKTVQAARDGSFWVGTYGGLARLSGERFVAYTEHDGLASNHVRAIHEDEQGTLWIGTYDGGLSRLRNGVFTNYTTATGLFSNGVFRILEDARGNFWMSSNQGIYRVSRRQLEDVAAGRIASVTSTAFGKSDGMLNAECNGGRQQAGVKTRDGKLWFPTQDGVAIIDPEAVPYNPLPPPVVIESAKVETLAVPFAQGLRLKPNQGNIEIRYSGLSLVKSEQVRFRYRLEGLDSAWVEAGTQRAAFYPYLPPGHYVFRVIAANSDLVWNQQGATLAMVVLPPYYRTWWFAGLVCLAAAAVASFAWRRRVAQLQHVHALQLAFSGQLIESQESERKRMAAELHDSLGQHLLIIKNRAALGDRLAANPVQSKEQFDEITVSATQAIDEVRRIAYNLRPLNLERLGLTTVMEELIEKVSASSGIQFFADIAPIDAALTPEGAIHLYRIVQESVNNIVRHGGATKASLEIRREDAGIHVTVSDNGCGFHIEPSARRGLGLTSIAERVRMLGGVHTLASTPGKGTTLTIHIPAQRPANEAAKGAANAC